VSVERKRASDVVVAKESVAFLPGPNRMRQGVVPRLLQVSVNQRAPPTISILGPPISSNQNNQTIRENRSQAMSRGGKLAPEVNRCVVPFTWNYWITGAIANRITAELCSSRI
jgi:hypothetical protein